MASHFVTRDRMQSAPRESGGIEASGKGKLLLGTGRRAST